MSIRQWLDPIPLLDAAGCSDLADIGLYVILSSTESTNTGKCYLPYYVGQTVDRGQGGILGRLQSHCVKLLGGAFTMWKIDEPNVDCGVGLSTYNDLKVYVNAVHYAPFPDAKYLRKLVELSCPHTLSDFVKSDELRGRAHDWVSNRLFVRCLSFSEVESPNDLQRRIKGAEAHLISELKQRYRLANARVGEETTYIDDRGFMDAITTFLNQIENHSS